MSGYGKDAARDSVHRLTEFNDYLPVREAAVLQDGLQRNWRRFNGDGVAMTCLFCSVPDDEKIYQGALWFARRDKFPVTEGHTLIIPNRHIAYLEELTEEEWSALFPLIRRFSGVGDFNVGINRGHSAGQTVFHVHIHVFPRKAGDVPNPRGGIRNFKPSLVPYL